MHFSGFLAGAALLGSASAALVERQTPEGACSTGLHVIAVGGANSTDPYAYGLLESLAQSIVNAVPDSSMASVPYNKVNVRNNSQAVPEGVTNLITYVNQYHGACPDGKIALVGYSAGAVITMNGICNGGVDQGLADNTIVATVVYGDQTRVAGLPYDKGTCVDNGGRLSYVRNPDGCGAFIPGIQSYCDVNDPECCGGPPEDYQIHFVYPGEYDQTATQWVVSRYNEATGNGGDSGSSSSVIVSSSPAPATSSAAPTYTMASSMVTVASSVPVVTVTTTTAPVFVPTSMSNSSIMVSPTPTQTPVPANPNAASAFAPSFSFVSAILAGAFGLVYIIA